MNHFRMLGFFDVTPVIPRLFKMQPAQWPGVEARGEPDICRSKSILLRHHENPTQENWLEDLPLEDDAVLKDWLAMRTLIRKVRDLIRQDEASRVAGGGRPFLDRKAPAGRVMLAGLAPQGVIQWHTDNGPYHSRHIRFHVPLVTNPGCVVQVQAEQVHMEVGALWWFNNRFCHTATNWGWTHRVHLILEMPTLTQDAEA